MLPPQLENTISSGQPDTLHAPPHFLVEDTSLFLDFDGTLVDLVDSPEDVIADELLRRLLHDLCMLLEGRLAVVSGRSVAQLDAMLGPIAQTIALSGSHGSEQRWRGILEQPHRPSTLDQAAALLRPFASAHSGVLVEEKSYGVALHYRNGPEAEQDARKLAHDLASELELLVQDGKMMVELRVPGGDKGLAVRRLMELPPMKGTRPIFIGDDRTDENAFVAASELEGFGVFVGSPHKTAAAFALPDPAGVRSWLSEHLA